MPVTRSASVRGLNGTAVVPSLVETKKGPSKRTKTSTSSRNALVENHSIGNTPSSSAFATGPTNKLSPNLQPTRPSPIDKIAHAKVQKGTPIRSFTNDDDQYDSDDSFEKSIIWSAKKARKQENLSASTTDIHNTGTKTRITYSPVLATILQDGISNESPKRTQPLSSQKNKNKLNPSASSNSLRRTALAKPTTTNSPGLSRSASVRGLFSSRQNSSTVSRTETNSPTPLSSSSPSQATTFEKKIVSAVTNVLLRKSSVKSQKQATVPAPFKFATDARSVRKRSTTGNEIPASADVTNNPPASVTRPTLQKKRSALFEREKVVKKSLSNLSLRSQYSVKNENASSRTMTPVQSSQQGAHLRSVQPVKESQASSNKQSSLLLPKASASTLDKPDRTSPNQSRQYNVTKNTSSLSSGMHGLQIKPQSSHANLNEHKQQLESLREAASEQGRRAVELWATRQRKL
ncbi:hypothetical protein V1514DRAFT_341945 [Lipomyces japonicus]|uniref:uncharacterized protein n=1 Tax=Lipomyces japonicus TaxID=56871 RepID=UPI0034CF5D80